MADNQHTSTPPGDPNRSAMALLIGKGIDKTSSQVLTDGSAPAPAREPIGHHDWLQSGRLCPPRLA